MSTADWRRNLVALWIGQALCQGAFSFIIPFTPLYVQTLGVHGTAEAAQWAAAITAAAALASAVAQPLWGNLADRRGRKPMVVRSMIGGGLTVILMGIATSPEQLLAIRLLQGLVTGTVAASNALAATSTPKNRLGFALGFMQVAIFSGTSIGPLIGGPLADFFGFRVACYVSGALLMLGAAVVALFTQEDFVRPAVSSSGQGLWTQSRSLLGMSLFPLVVGVIFLIQLAGTVVSPVLTLFIVELHSAENAATVAGVVLGLTGGVGAISALVIGRISDRVGHGRILLVCLLGAAATYFPQAFVQQVWQLLLLRMLLGVCLGGLMPTANALMAGIVPHERRGAAFGLGAAANSLANAAGPLSGAGIATHLGLRAVFLATGVLFTLASLWASLVLKGLTRRQRSVAVSVQASPPQAR